MSSSSDITRPAYLSEPGMHEVSASFDAFRESVTRAKRMRDTGEDNSPEAKRVRDTEEDNNPEAKRLRDTEKDNNPGAKRLRLKEELEEWVKGEVKEELVLKKKLLGYKERLSDALGKVYILEGALEISRAETDYASKEALNKGRERDQYVEDYSNCLLELQDAKKKIAAFEREKNKRRAARRDAREAAQAAAREAAQAATREAEEQEAREAGAKSASWLFW